MPIVFFIASCSLAQNTPLTTDLAEATSNTWSFAFSLQTNDQARAETTGLRFDAKEKYTGQVSVACDVKVSGKTKTNCGYIQFRFQAPQPLDLAQYRAVRFAYQVTADAPMNPWLTIVEDWGKGSADLDPVPGFSADGAWHEIEVPFFDFKSIPTNWAWPSMKYFLINFTVNIADTNRTTTYTVRLDRLELIKRADLVGRKPALFFDLQPDTKLTGELKKSGYTWYAPPRDAWKKWSRRLLSNFNAVILTEFPQTGTGGLSPEQQTYIELLKWYIEQGGGLFICGGNNQDTGMCVKFQNEFLKPYGAEVLREFIKDKEFRYKGRCLTYAWTRNIEKQTLTEGVNGLFYPMLGGWGGTSAANPLKAGEGWNILVRGMPSAYSCALYDSKEMEDKPAGYTNSPPLVAVKDTGKGRIVLWPTLGTTTFTDGYHYMWDDGIILDGKAGEYSSQGLILLKNLLKYLTQTSLASGQLGGFEPSSVPPEKLAPPKEREAINWNDIRIGEGIANVHKILIGARTAYSSGQGTVADYAAEAKKHGYQAVIFTEDLEAMSPEKWTALKTECRKFCTNDFLAVEGLKFFDENGNQGVVFGDIGWPKQEWMSESKPGRLKAIWHLTHGYHFWPPVAVITPKSNPKRPWFLGKCKGYAAFTYENGKLIDESFDEYLEMMRLRFDNFVIAAHLLNSPKEVANAAKPENMQTYVRAPKVTDIVNYMSDTYNKEVGWYWPVFVSAGPMIKTLAAYAGGDLTVKGSERIRLRMQASSAEPIKEARLYDGKKLVRRFLMNEPSLDRTIDLCHDRQHSYVLEVIDQKGHRAISWQRWTEVMEQWYTNCGDNWNYMAGGKWSQSRFMTMRGLETYFGRASIDSVWPPDIQLVEGDKTRSFLPSGHGYPAIHCDKVMVSRFASVIDYVVLGVYDKGSSANWNDFCKREGIIPLTNGTLKIRCTFFTSRPDHPQIRLYQGTAVFKDSATIQKHTRVNVISSGGKNEYNCLSWCDASGMKITDIRPESLAKERSFSFMIAPGGYVSLWPSIAGSVGVFALDAGMRCSAWHQPGASAFRLSVGESNTLYKAGEALSYRYLEVFGRRFPDDISNQEMEQVQGAFGLQGATAYRVEPMVGSIISSLYTLRLKPENGGFLGHFKQARLPVAIPVMVEGLNERWQAGVWYKGTNEMWQAAWDKDEYGRLFAAMKARKVTDDFQPGPVEEGIGYFQIDVERSDRDVFAGNFLISDNKDVFLQVLERQPERKMIEVHNPTDKPIDCTVRPAKGFDLLGSFAKKVSVPPGQSIAVDVNESKR